MCILLISVRAGRPLSGLVASQLLAEHVFLGQIAAVHAQRIGKQILRDYALLCSHS